MRLLPLGLRAGAGTLPRPPPYSTMLIAQMHQPDLLDGMLPSPEPQPPAGTSFWLDAGTAIVEGDGILVRMDEAMQEWLELRSGPPAMSDFGSLLSRRGSETFAAYEMLRRSSGEFSKSQFCISMIGAASGQWMQMEIARFPGGYSVRLSSVLPPLNELEEATWDEHLRSDSARRSMFMRLLRAESQLDRLMKRWPGVIFRQRPDFSFQFVSQNIEALTGISVEDWCRLPGKFWEIIHDGDARELQEMLSKAAKTGASCSFTYRVCHFQTKKVSYVLEHRQPILTRNGLLLGYEGFWVDVTRQTIAEKRLTASSWKETLAALTLGLAHDFRNIMAGIHCLSENFLTEIDPSHKFYEGLDLIKTNSMQASNLVHRMINLHLGQTGERNYHDLNEIVNDLSGLARIILPKSIGIESHPAPHQLPVYVDPVEFQRVIINLSLNAADAMASKGTLTFRTSRHDRIPAKRHTKGIFPKLPAVCLEVSDTGCGIPERHLAMIFDAFFTTKGAQRGTGLGLYITQSFAEKHGGMVTVESTEGVGTSFCLWLPEATFDTPAEPRAGEVVRRRTLLLAGSGGHMLEHRVRRFREIGYQVVTACSVEGVDDTLNTGHPVDGVMFFIEPADQRFPLQLPEIRRRLGAKFLVMLQLVGRNADEIDAVTSGHADEIFSSDAMDSHVEQRLAALLQSGE